SIHLVSAKQGENLEPIVDFLKNLWQEIAVPGMDTAVNLRQKALLEKLLQHLQQIERWQAQRPAPTELIAEEVRSGLQLIGELTGAIGSADILDGIFARFCIGK
ncbi:MAG TPA: tRNA uridine-5-carboxymethylaminomethyl(34) synthesis GTPase MnmE, partial [Candidatus Binatia bacterium]|nr:tRNA uridine-5-carboxymethylaminomethyl(34) synthesis GTPase MnmE [Candidatus Binatia bacterium]